MGASVDPAALRAARERAGLTQHQLARLVGVAGGERDSRCELGTSEPRPEILVRLAKVLDVPALDLLDVTDGAELRSLRFAAGLSPSEADGSHVAMRCRRPAMARSTVSAGERSWPSTSSPSARRSCAPCRRS